MSIQKHNVYYRSGENEFYYYDENGVRQDISLNMKDYALSADVDNRIDGLSGWVDETFQYKGDYVTVEDLDIELSADAITSISGYPLAGINVEPVSLTGIDGIQVIQDGTDYVISVSSDYSAMAVDWVVGQDYALSADVDTALDETVDGIVEWANDTFVTSANIGDVQYALTTSGWMPVSGTVTETTELVAGQGVTFREGTGQDLGKTFVEVDSTNYKLLSVEEYNKLLAAVNTVSSYSARWVLTNS